MIKVNQTGLPGVLLIERKIAFDDPRGFFAEEWNKELYRSQGIDIEFVTSEFSRTKSKWLRGLHGDTKTWKLLSCNWGCLFLAVVNYDQKSEFFCKHETFILTPENGYQVLVPPMHLNGHYVMSPDYGQLKYMQSEYYSGAENQFSVRWNDPRFNITWPSMNPFLSERDGG